MEKLMISLCYFITHQNLVHFVQVVGGISSQWHCFSKKNSRVQQFEYVDIVKEDIPIHRIAMKSPDLVHTILI